MSQSQSNPGSFSLKSRTQSLTRFRVEQFDLLIIGGGITGAAVARDAAYRGLSVALVEQNDFAFGTSSRSSKLIHGGLRYLENLEFNLVFEALSERALLLKTSPHLVRPLPFYFPVFDGAKPPMWKLSLGLWLYDALSLFRSPGFHKRLGRRKFIEAIPFLNAKKLLGGFLYYDASMWDDRMVIEILRSAQRRGVASANYVRAVEPIWEDKLIKGFKVRDQLDQATSEISIRAKQVIVCAGPWTDEVGGLLGPQGKWKPVLKPSLGIHLVFDWTRIPVPGAMVMANPSDGRISFVMPRRDLGAGVTIVGTTDSPAPSDIGTDSAPGSDVHYLMNLLKQFFPSLHLSISDILSHYVGVRPLVNPHQGEGGNSLQKISREHHIDVGPGGVVWVAGGKYTTHRTMAEEIMNFAAPHTKYKKSTKKPFNLSVNAKSVAQARRVAAVQAIQVPERLWEEYGAEALDIMSYRKRVDEILGSSRIPDPEGFPCIYEQFVYHFEYGMVARVEDFIRRRVPLFLSRADHGDQWMAGFEKLLKSLA
ncbi:MAG: glycerol-3-phosphate dehydrogenase/oxidase [Xanthomonadaceae bacterium]|nr:glycerol-3-phosphate dehydrogenase/oxidase [Xanthomonadaceae bacterium]